jgi:hypothetical protein
MELKSKMQSVMVYVTNTLKRVGAVSVIIMAIGAGFVVGYYYETLTKKIEDNNQFKHVRLKSETTIGISDKNQLMIMDHNTGAYKIYEDSVGLEIFRMYSKIQFSQLTK